MMQFMLCHNNNTQIGGQELIQQWRDKTDSWIWLDLQDEPAEKEQALLMQQFAA